jgi:hypothetical protein
MFFAPVVIFAPFGHAEELLGGPEAARTAPSEASLPMSAPELRLAPAAITPVAPAPVATLAPSPPPAPVVAPTFIAVGARQGDGPKPQRDWAKDQAWTLFTSDGLCTTFEGVEPAASEESRGVRLEACWGRAATQWVALTDGELLIGRASVIAPEPIPIAPEPIPEHPGMCHERSYESYLRSYRVRICLGAASLTSTQIRFDIADPDHALLEITYPTVDAPLVPGHPLRTEHETAAERRSVAWLYERRPKRLRLDETNLCLTAMPDDLSPGAPLYLDRCNAPMGANGDEGPGLRQRVSPRSADFSLEAQWRPSRAMERLRETLRQERQSASR